MKTRERILLALLEDNPWQPRQEIDPDALEKLAASIQKVGLLQAPLARTLAGGRIQIAFGHRRVAACRLLHQTGRGEPYIEMDVDDELTDEEMAVMALAENVDRRQLTQMEVLRAHRKAVDETNLTLESLAEELGIARSTLSNNLRVLELPDFVLEYVESGALRVGVAREFLVLQNADHAHVDDMQAVISAITNNYRVAHQGALPNWSRKNVRLEIAERVANNEQDFRPLGRREAGMPGLAGAVRETTFDIEAFSQERPDAIHTIPAGDKSRIWTCDVKEWRRRQTQASREANKQSEASGTKTNAGRYATPSPDKQFEQALSKDPVWKGIVARRGTKGPNRPVTDEERAALGTRAELKSVDPYGAAFWKILENARPEAAYEWDRDRQGGRVPPFFIMGTADCGSCIAGAAYAKPKYDYTGDGVKFVCTNQSCYDRKLAGDEAVHREKVEAKLVATNGEDSGSVKVIMGRLALLTRKDLRTLASSLIAAQPELELTHAMGVPHKKWSYKPMTVRYVTGMLTHRPAHFDGRGRTDAGKVELDLESLNEVPDGDLLELTATLMTYHLRQAGKLDTVSRETAAPPDPLAVREMLAGEQVPAEARA